MLDSQTVKAMARALGAEAVGIAPAERFLAAPEGFRPTDIYPKCRSVVVFMKAMPADLLDTANPVPYSNAAFILYGELDQLGMNLARAMKAEGAATVPMPCDAPYLHWEEAAGHGMGILSMRHAAQLAGLGVLGRNTLLVNPDLGNLGYIGAVLTAAELAPDPLVEGHDCPDGCSICLDACPEQALDGHVANQKRCRARSIAKVGRGFTIYNCNICRRQCPRSQGY
jgi:epoxyqueuosine reductase QueG